MMNETELIQVVNAMEANTVGKDDTFITDNQKYFNYYMGEPFGDEKPNRSHVVSTDVADVVESDMPSLIRVFLGSGQILEFQPNSQRQEDIQEADEKNIYIPHILRTLPNSFKKQHDWLKAIEIYKVGVLEYGINEAATVKKRKFKRLDADEMTAYLDEFERDADISEVKITSQNSFKEDQQEFFDLEVSLVYEKKEFFIENIPVEDAIISQGAQTKEEADLIGKRWTKTRGELVEDGFDEKLVKSLTKSKHTENTQLKEDRFSGQGGTDDKATDQQLTNNAEVHWTMELVSGIDVYAKVDFDEDGHRERRHIIKSGSTILLNEDFDHVPYAIASSIMMPHNIVGRSRAEITCPYQRKNSVLERSLLDNTYMVGAGRNIISNKVNMDDMLSVRQNGIVRFNGDDPVTNHVLPLVTPYVGDKTLQVLQYCDSKRAQTTGSLMANQGLQSDDIHKETATRFRGVEDAAAAKVELLTRVIASAYAELYQGLAWFANHFQDSDQEIFVLGQTLTTNPSKWQFEQYIEPEVGIGAGDDQQMLQNHSALLSIQEQLQARGSALVDEKKIFNQIKRISGLMGVKDVSTVINDPEQPQQLLMAENEQLRNMVQQAQVLLSQQANPLAEAETIKANKELALRQQQLANDNQQFLLELEEKRRQFNIKTATDMEKHGDDTAVKLTEMELESNQHVPGSLV